MAEPVTLRYQGEILGIGWGEAGGLFGGFASLDNKTGRETQGINFDPSTQTLDDGSTVDGRFEVIVHQETDTDNEATARDELATDIWALGVADLAGSKEEALNDIESDLFSLPVARIEAALSGQGVSATRSEIKSALSAIDQHQIKLDVKSNISYERWDRSSSINGTSASEMEAREGVPDTAPVYLVRDVDTGEIVFFQYIDPINGGNLTESDWESVAQQHIDQIAEERASNQVTEAVINNL
jgi:hypothetical protein